MMNGTETVQRRVTEPGGMLAATTLTWMADIVIELAPPMLMAWVGEAGKDKKTCWRGLKWSWDQQISDFHDALH